MNDTGQDSALRVIHLALAAGVVVFAALVLGVLGPASGSGSAWLRGGWLVVACGVLLAAGVLRRRAVHAGTSDRRRMAAISIWALAEAQALLGLLTYLLGGDPLPATLGLLLFAYLWYRHRPSRLVEETTVG